MQGVAFRVGPWGGSEGKYRFDVTEAPNRLVSLAIQTRRAIAVFSFTYADVAGKEHTVGPIGGDHGELTTVSEL